MAHEMAVATREDATGNFKIVLTTIPGMVAEGPRLRDVLGAVAGDAIDSGEDTETLIAVEGHHSITEAVISVRRSISGARTDPAEYEQPRAALGQ